MINKLKVKKISKYYLIVTNEYGQKGSVYISEAARFYIDDLVNYFKEGDIVYGKQIGKHKQVISYSLKIGHTKEDAKYENGGGFLVLKNFLNDFGRDNND